MKQLSIYWFLIVTFASSLHSYESHILLDSRQNNFQQIKLTRVVGPESIAFDCKGDGPYTGVSDGRILKWHRGGWREFAFTSSLRNRSLCNGINNHKLEPVCGRPLGLKFHSATCDLYIADAYFGLVKVGPSGGAAKQLVAGLGGIPFRLTNALDIDANTGVVYFTDSSTLFERWEFIVSVLTGDATGRLMKYDLNSKKVTVLLDGIAFANGVALSKDKSFIVIAETSLSRILRFWLKGPKANTKEVFAQLDGRYPDNIKSNAAGEFWVGLNTGRGALDKSINSDTDAKVFLNHDAVAVRLDENGTIVELVDGNGGTTLDSVSEVEEHKGTLWVGSVVMPYVGVFRV